LARDLKHWIEILQTLYVIFVVPPFTGKLARSLLKESKIFFYDNGKVRNDPAARLENLVACALLKDLQRGEDLHAREAIQVVGSLKTKASTPSMRMTTAVDFLVGHESS
jgi:predicted AAA+ superfamily ATPase